jgi:hypothetical protein
MGIKWLLILTYLLVLGEPLGLVSASDLAQTESTSSPRFEDKAAGIAISWPSELVQDKSPAALNAAALLILKPAQGRYPTINLLQAPGPFDVSKAATLIADSYRLVGFTDAIVTRYQLLSSGWPYAELRYRGNDGFVTSRVLIISGPNSHLILTMINDPADPSNSDKIWESISSSIKVDPKILHDSTYNLKFQGHLWNSTLLLVFVGLITALLLRRYTRG